jgi:hypothetical protein
VTQGTIIKDIADTIRKRKELPLFVSEGKTIQKTASIKFVPYLSHCYNKLISTSGSLFVYGHSASPGDAHIYDAICLSKITKVFFFVHKPTENLPLVRERLAAYGARRGDIEWSYVDAATAKVWGH